MKFTNAPLTILKILCRFLLAWLQTRKKQDIIIENSEMKPETEGLDSFNLNAKYCQRRIWSVIIYKNEQNDDVHNLNVLTCFK